MPFERQQGEWMAEVLTGYVEKIVFRNTDNGYTVISLVNEEMETTCVGNFPFISEGEFIEVTGGYSAHPVYGEQFQVKQFQVKEPEDVIAMERYLASGAIKGIGVTLAGRIIKKFQKETFHIIEEEPERLSEVKGISEKLAREIYQQFTQKQELRNAMLFLQQYGITNNLAVKIYQKYGEQMYQVMKENPYRLAEDISGVGFKIADEIAMKTGIGAESDYRIHAAILYALTQAAGNGHIYLPESELLYQTTQILGMPLEDIKRHITVLSVEKKVVLKKEQEECCIYLAIYYYLELNTAKMLLDLSVVYPISGEAILARLTQIEKKLSLALDEMQRQAVIEAVRNGLFILTGGPGTGKTTTINAMIQFFESEGMDILLAAPTGRAAKRMTETTGYEAKTIHRLLELTQGLDSGEKHYQFERNETNPLETDVIIIDEMSMVDINLVHALLRAVTVGTRLILVGDENQLPSVGPGNVLHDILASKLFQVVRLKKIFRQASESDIIVNAHKINAGTAINFNNHSKDFFLLKRSDINSITGVMIALVRDKMPRYVNANPLDIQVLTPMRKGELGVDRLNQILQQYLNPPSKDKKEKEHKQYIFREGDKVMQTKNDYQLPWEIKTSFGTLAEQGTGVFNGDTGIIREINSYSESMKIEFDEGRMVEYPFVQLDELELAYAVTIHKAQGSEYPAIVLPLLNGPRMLFNRNILYTAVTRAKSCVTIVGSEETVQAMIANEREQMRYSGLCQRIQELSKL